jgi:hypothetical protein
MTIMIKLCVILIQKPNINTEFYICVISGTNSIIPEDEVLHISKCKNITYTINKETGQILQLFKLKQMSSFTRHEHKETKRVVRNYI